MTDRPEILVVDDEPETLAFVSALLRDEGFAVHTAGAVAEALGVLARTGDVRLVITDVNMPGRSGLDLLRAVKAHSPLSPRVIVMSGFADVTPEDLFALGAHDFVTKPFAVKSFAALARGHALQRLPRIVADVCPLEGDREVVAEWPGLEAAERSGTLLLGQGGFFIAGAEHAGARTIHFRLLVAGFGLLLGRGTVRWARHAGTAAGPPGAGVQITEITGPSHAVLRRHAENRRIAAVIPNRQP